MKRHIACQYEPTRSAGLKLDLFSFCVSLPMKRHVAPSTWGLGKARTSTFFHFRSGPLLLVDLT